MFGWCAKYGIPVWEYHLADKHVFVAQWFVHWYSSHMFHSFQPVLVEHLTILQNTT